MSYVGLDMAKAMGKLAKTAGVDAHHFAYFGEALQPAPQAIPDTQQIELRALVERRRQWVQMRTLEKQRLETAAPPSWAWLPPAQPHPPSIGNGEGEHRSHATSHECDVILADRGIIFIAARHAIPYSKGGIKVRAKTRASCCYVGCSFVSVRER